MWALGTLVLLFQMFFFFYPEVVSLHVSVNQYSYECLKGNLYRSLSFSLWSLLSFTYCHMNSRCLGFCELSVLFCPLKETIKVFLGPLSLCCPLESPSNSKLGDSRTCLVYSYLSVIAFFYCLMSRVLKTFNVFCLFVVFLLFQIQR